ncbi:hypothetical protein SO802_033394 [Lithocarpus litseifolius]|uniref:RNase H type-1 domain-containing protein n=1 Tax=Lithocarpus litseifolius TaxID=425828 RepID=A0AAW2BGE9_9ROSI
MGLGVIIRNNLGQVLASLSEQIQLPFSSDLVEALAAARAISFAQELNFSNFILEGDSELVIKALKNNDESLSPFGHILASAKAITDVNCISFSHTRRLGNAVAHNLACKTCHRFGQSGQKWEHRLSLALEFNSKKVGSKDIIQLCSFEIGRTRRL